MPIFYECDRCTACCRWPGQVKLTDAEITRMSVHLGVAENDFIQTYTRLNNDRTGLALQDKESGECIFLQGGDCRVNPVKPQQCRNFPNLWNFPGFEQVCSAKSISLAQADYEAAVERATGLSIRSVS
ncbi:MAG TPA: YkgJ family cysteine cluster protein [Verrucomicrobiae bacterium]